MAIYNFVLILTVYENGFHTKRESTEDNSLVSWMTLTDFVIGNGTNVCMMGNDTLAHQTNGLHNVSEWIVGTASRNQVIGRSIDEKIRKAVDDDVMTDKNCMRDVILTAIDKVVIPRVEMAVRSITGSSRHGPNSVVQNSDRKDFTGNTENTPLMSTSSRLDLNIDYGRIDETRHVENFEDGDFSALKHNYDRRVHAHHNAGLQKLSLLTGMLNLSCIITWKELSLNVRHCSEIDYWRKCTWNFRTIFRFKYY